MLRLAILLFVFWLIAVIVLHIIFPLIHLLLVIAVIVVLLRVIRGKKPLGDNP